jgi:hypothetical protein
MRARCVFKWSRWCVDAEGMKPLRISRLRRALLTGLTGIVLAAAANVVPKAPAHAAASSKKIAPGVNLGFNAKGTVDTTTQLAQVRAIFATLDPKVVRSWTIRVTGGTRSQTDFPAMWSDEQIAGWVELQRTYGFGYAFVVNGNDTPENQAAFIQRWTAAGARIVFVELMNEYYLARYRNGDRSFDEVTRSVSPQEYVDEILPAWLPVLKPLGLPMYIIAAPDKESPNNTKWNATVAKALKTSLAGQRLGVTVHLYARNGQKFDYGQIGRLRAQLPPGTKIAVTEAGVLDAKSAADVRAHLLAIALQLRTGETLLEQILYKPDASSFEGSITDQGLSVKGAAVLELYTTRR